MMSKRMNEKLRFITLFFLVVVMLMPVLPAKSLWSEKLHTEVQAAPSVNIGDYIQFGRYNNAPILWRVIHKDTNGDPILFADRILTFKAFDAKGSYHTGNTERVNYGSNFYKDSNIRQWLNSSSANSGANTIDWIQNDPSATNMWNGYNPYNTEKGFLADGNFTSTERGLIKPYMHKVILHSADQAKKDGGTANHSFNSDIANVVQNYDTTAYFQNVTDSIFMLSVKQLKEWVYDNRGVLGTNYHIAKPTAEAVTQSTYKVSSLNSGSNWTYWLSSPSADYSGGVRCVGFGGIVDYDGAFAGSYTIGVRPALQLNLQSAIFKSGTTGSSSNPYVVEGGGSSGPASDPLAPSAPSNLGANSVSATALTLAWGASTDNVGVTGYEIYQNGSLLTTISGSTTSQVVSGLSASTNYSFFVRAKDLAGNTSNSSNTLNVTTQSAGKNVNIGDYIQFGRYNNAPILWRVIHKDVNGDPILFADRILTIKAFDANGSYHTGTTDLVNYGSNFYKDSNIRQWLNSSSPNSGANTIDWIQNDPSAANMSGGYNPYNTEKGFIADGNFTSAERSLIKPYTHKVLLAGVDQAKKDGGTTNHSYNSDIANIVQNYDTTAYFQNVTDSIFMLSVKQLKEWVYDNRGVLGTSYHIAKPTAEAVTQSTYKTSSLNSSSNWYYWLNTPYSTGSHHVRYVYFDVYVSFYSANYNSLGVRPALHLNLQSAIFKSGTKGTSSNPYVVSGGSSVPADTTAPSAPSNLGANSVSATELTLAWGASTDNVGVTGYEIYQNGSLLTTVSGSTTSQVVSGLSASTNYSFFVRAKDLAGNTSNSSNTLNVRTLAPPDTQSPTIPRNLNVSIVTENTLSLSWTSSNDNVGVTGYEIYQDGILLTTVSGTTTSYIVSGLTPSTSYAYTVRAKDSAGNTSNSSNTLIFTTESAGKNVNIGDYIQFGRYNNKPILWRVIHKDANGDPILFADRILTIKAFDAKGSYHPVGDRRNYGSNFYKDSNIRQWLNSSSPNSGANRIDWIQNDPSAANMWGGYNPYNTEKGFLADGNFTSAERSLIKPYTHKVLLAGVDQAKKNGGTTNHTYRWDIYSVVENYDTNAYFQNVTDSIFMLSVKQLKEWVYDNDGVLGTSYHIAKPTAEAVTQSTYKTSSFNSGSYWDYWLNSPNADDSYSVRYVYLGGTVNNSLAVYTYIGVRPALHLNLQSATFASGGSGTSSNPYVVEGGGSSAPADTTEPSAPSNLGANSVSANALTLAWGASTDNNGVTGYEIYQDGILIDTVSAREYTFDGLYSDTQYAFAIRARDAAGNRSAASEILYVRTQKEEDVVPPDKITDLWVIGWSITPSTLSVSFTSAIDDRVVDRYQIEWRDNQGNVQSGSIYVTDQNKENYEYYISNLKSYTKYWIKVRAYDRAGNVSNWSKEIEDRTKDNLKPSVPSNIRASQITSTSFKLSWSSSQDNAGVNGYKISLNGSLFRTSQTNSMTISNRKPGTTYTLRVLAYDAAGNESSYSSPISVTTSGGGLTFNGALSANVQSYNSLTLSWNCAKSSAGIREYRIRRDNFQVAVTPSNRCNAEVGGISSGSNSTYTVTAVDREGKTESKTLRYTFNPTLRLSGNSLTFNGRPVRLSSSPKTSDALVPYNNVFSALGLTSSYNANTKTIRASKPGGVQITLTVGIKPKATVDKRTFNLNSPVQLYGGVPFVPLDFFGQALGVKVQR